MEESEDSRRKRKGKFRLIRRKKKKGFEGKKVSEIRRECEALLTVSLKAATRCNQAPLMIQVRVRTPHMFLHQRIYRNRGLPIALLENLTIEKEWLLTNRVIF